MATAHEPAAATALRKVRRVARVISNRLSCGPRTGKAVSIAAIRTPPGRLRDADADDGPWLPCRSRTRPGRRCGREEGRAPPPTRVWQLRPDGVQESAPDRGLLPGSERREGQPWVGSFSREACAPSRERPAGARSPRSAPRSDAWTCGWLAPGARPGSRG